MNDYRQNTINLWYPDQVEPIYDPLDPISDLQFKEYWKREKERCVDGFYLADGKIFISGWLYFHTVYWKIVMYINNKKGKKVREVKTPFLRDLDWDIAADLTKCEEDGLFYGLIGSRDFGKSVIAASRAAWLYTFFDNSESVISSSADPYIKLATDKIEDGLMNLHPMFKKQRLASDWKAEVRAGWKDKKTNQPHAKSSMSVIFVRNYKMGNNTMAANGTRPGFHLIDEIGTLPNLIGCIKDSDGCWWSGNGDKPSCLVMIAGTGGDQEQGPEAAEVFNNPEAYNLLQFNNIWEPGGGKIGRFIPATRAKMAYKESVPLSSYLGIDHPDLEKITILVSNEERALKEWWEPEYKKALKSGNQKTVTKFKAYWPLIPSDSFLRISKNDFNVEAAKRQKEKLRIGEVTGIPIELYHDGEKIVHKFTDKLPITEFPLKTQLSDGCVVMYEPPITNAPWGLYVAGIDPYKQDTSKYSDSLGAVYIYKRMHNILDEKFQDMFVAQYVGRPDSRNTWNETVRNLVKYYNAQALCENEDYGWIEYMINKGDAMYLVEQPKWLTEIAPNTSLVGRRKYGLPALPRIISHINGLYKSYTEEVVAKELDDKGSVIKEHLGFSRIMDPMLLEETIQFGDGNYDRIRAAAIAICQARKLDGMGILPSDDEDPRLKSYRSRTRKQSTSKLLGGGNPISTMVNNNRLKKLFS
jgi:hypothetical protein